MSHPFLNLAAIVIIGLVVFAVSLAVRRRAPGLERVDTGPWSATLAYVATAYGVLIGFCILLMFGQFADARRAVGDEATSVGTAFEQAALFPDSAPEVQSALVCYAEAASAYDWPAMRRGSSAPEVDRAFSALVRSLGENDAAPAGALHSATATNLVAQIGSISTARETRLVAAEAGLPAMLWVLLIGGGAFVAVLNFVVTLPARPTTQAGLVATTAAFTTMMLLLIVALGAPFAAGPGRVSPRLIEETVVAMRSSPNAATLTPCPTTVGG